MSFIRRYRTRRFVVALGSFKSCHDQRWMPTFSSRITIDGGVGNNGAAKPIAVALRPREGLLTEPTAGAQRWPRERVLMPQTSHQPTIYLAPCADAGGNVSLIRVHKLF
jgi:hypothetical protein